MFGDLFGACGERWVGVGNREVRGEIEGLDGLGEGAVGDYVEGLVGVEGRLRFLGSHDS